MNIRKKVRGWDGTERLSAREYAVLSEITRRANAEQAAKLAEDRKRALGSFTPKMVVIRPKI